MRWAGLEELVMGMTGRVVRVCVSWLVVGMAVLSPTMTRRRRRRSSLLGPSRVTFAD